MATQFDGGDKVFVLKENPRVEIEIPVTTASVILNNEATPVLELRDDHGLLVTWLKRLALGIQQCRGGEVLAPGLSLPRRASARVI